MPLPQWSYCFLKMGSSMQYFWVFCRHWAIAAPSTRGRVATPVGYLSQRYLCDLLISSSTPKSYVFIYLRIARLKWREQTQRIEPGVSLAANNNRGYEKDLVRRYVLWHPSRVSFILCISRRQLC